MYKDTAGDMMGKRGLEYVITDSWEAGVQNWTDYMIAEFTKRRGYDMRPWLPVLTGRVVESAEASDRFLWDFRRSGDRGRNSRRLSVRRTEPFRRPPNRPVGRS